VVEHLVVGVVLSLDIAFACAVIGFGEFDAEADLTLGFGCFLSAKFSVIY
jgi:hypothetical protein